MPRLPAKVCGMRYVLLSDTTHCASLQFFLLYFPFCSLVFWCKPLIATAPSFVQHGRTVERDVDAAILGSELVVADSASSDDVERTAASLRDTTNSVVFAACTVATDSSHA